MRRAVLRLSLLAVSLAAAPHGSGGDGAAANLAVWTGDRWSTFWSPAAAPHHWAAGHPAVLQAVQWEQAGAGVETAELRLAAGGVAWRLRVVLVRLDPRVLTFELREATREEGLLGAWTVDSMPPHAVAGFNAGQFHGGQSWGWRVEHGRELQPPGTGSLGMAVVLDRVGAVRLLEAERIEGARRSGAAVLAFQSYPAVLVDDGRVPPPLLAPGRGVDLAHRDTRFALGELGDGRLLLALTRFDALGGAAGAVPFGPTTPEMAAVMGALGARRAVLLDGGLSAQLAVRTGAGELHAWRGLRRVPLGIVARIRQ